MAEESAIQALQALTTVVQSVLKRIDEVFIPTEALRRDLAVLESRYNGDAPVCAEHRSDTAEIKRNMANLERDFSRRIDDMERENAVLRERLGMLSKVLWAFAVPLIGLLVKTMFDLLTHKSGVPLTTGSLFGVGASGLTLFAARLVRL